ncbi:serine hydrolase, partial [Staphylococcus saprophyticus]|uniref:serine hydrolase n=1 Tax=Staphylococcus saprophyticus TaxID=29385 RepID=UPI0011A58A68
NQYLEQLKFNRTAPLFQNPQLKLNKPYPFQNIQQNKHNQPHTLYLIASSQKFPTPLIFKQLQTQNKININHSLTKYFPSFKINHPITLNQLIFHKS